MTPNGQNPWLREYAGIVHRLSTAVSLQGWARTGGRSLPHAEQVGRVFIG